MCRTESRDVAISMVNRGMASKTLHEVFEAMSPTARYMRYLAASPRLTTAMVRVLSDVDGSRHAVWRATCGDRTVGLVRLHDDREGAPELAVEVVDDHHGRGIGKALVATALRHAAKQGARSVQVLVHPDNMRAIRLFRSVGASFVFRSGLLEGVVPATTYTTVAA